jgi:hypothetical protein
LRRLSAFSSNLARRVKRHPPPSQTSGQLKYYCDGRKTGLPQEPHATGLRAPLRSPMPSLHSVSQVSSLRRTVWCDQSGVEFSAKGLRTQRRFRRRRACARSTRMVKDKKPTAGAVGFEKMRSVFSEPKWLKPHWCCKSIQRTVQL